MDYALYAFIVFVFATWCTVHLVLCVELAKKDWKRAMGGFFAFPLAPYFGYNLAIKKLSALWVVSAVLYAFSLTFGSL
jgi:hypothetical protein